MSLRGNERPTRSDPGLAAEKSSGVAEKTDPVCRICHTGSGGSHDEGPLLTPCLCRGSVGFAHKKCMEEWLRQLDTDQCDICLYRFTLRRRFAPLWHYFRDPNHRTDIIRMMVNVASCVGDIIILVFAWTYASGFLGKVGWLMYLFIVAVLLFQTVFWFTVEVIRAITCSEPLRKWRRRTASIELLLEDGDSTIPGKAPRKVPSITPIMIPAVHSPTLLVSSPILDSVSATPDRTSIKQKPATSARLSISAENTPIGAPKEEKNRVLHNTL